MREEETVVALVGQGVETSRIARALRELERGYGQRFRTLAVVEAGGSGGFVERVADDVLQLPEGVELNQAAEISPLLAARDVSAVVPDLGSGGPVFPWAKRAEAEGWKLIGPSVGCLRRWLDPTRLRQTAQSIGISTIPWSGKVLHTLEEVRAHAARLGFPVLLRAPTTVQTGLGVARTAKELEDTFAAAVERSERAADVNAGGVLLERLLPGVRRLEVPLVSFPDGRRWILDVIDASLRRRDGSVIVEAPAPGLEPRIEKKLRVTVAQFAEVLKHEHVGTMAFLHRPGSEQVTFLGYDFGRGGEHAAAEMLRGVDLAKLRAALGLGLPLPEGEAPAPRGHAMAAQLRVEAFEPDPVLSHFRPASGPGVRTDSDARAGDRLYPQAAVAEIIAHGSDRSEALARLRGALAESAYVVRGGETSMSALLQLTGSPELENGPVVVDWWIQQLRKGGLRSRQHAAEALLIAAADTHAIGHAADREEFVASAARGRPETRPPTKRAVELELDGTVHRMEVTALDVDRYEIGTNDGPIELRFQRGQGPDRVMICGGTRFEVTASRTGRQHEVLVNGEPHRIVHRAGGVVRAEFPAIVVDLAVAEGEVVEAGAVVATLEAMKMELEVRSDYGGRVRRVLVQRGQQVSPSQPLVWLESATSEASNEAHTPVRFSELAARSTPPSSFELLQSFFRGFDVNQKTATEAASQIEPSQDLSELLAAFISLLELAPSSPELEDAPDGGLRLGYGEYVGSFLMSWDPRGLPQNFLLRLQDAVQAYGAATLERSTELVEGLFRLHMAIARRSEIVVALLGVLGGQLEQRPTPVFGYEYRRLLERLIALTQSSLPEVCDTARAVQFRLFDGPYLARLRAGYVEDMDRAMTQIAEGPSRAAIEQLVTGPLAVTSRLTAAGAAKSASQRAAFLEILLRRYYRSRDLSVSDIEVADSEEPFVLARVRESDTEVRTVVGWLGELDHLAARSRALAEQIRGLGGLVALELVIVRTDIISPTVDLLQSKLSSLEFPSNVDRVVFIIGAAPGEAESSTGALCRSFVRRSDCFEPYGADTVHPMIAERLGIDRLSNFDLELVSNEGDLYAFIGQGKGQPNDQRVFVHAEVRDLTPVQDASGELVGLPELEQVCAEALACLRGIRRSMGPKERTETNRLELYLRPPIEVDARASLMKTLRNLAPTTVGLGLEEITVTARGSDGEKTVFCLSDPSSLGVEVRAERPKTEPLELMSSYQRKVAKLRRRGLTHPYDLARLLTPDENAATPELPRGSFEELELDDVTGRLVPIERPPGDNLSNIIVGKMTTYTSTYPEGMARIALFGDPSRAMGSLAEPECRRVMAALDLAEEIEAPVEWYAISGGAEISKARGTENMDWISAVLRRIIEFTQGGHELNVVVCGINVGAQPYWNAEATMLMHTKGILVMVPGSAMVLTGKQALDFSGGISAEDNLGIGGYDRIMGPNGQAQYYAEDLVSAGKLLLRYYAHSYCAPGERFPRRRTTSDPHDRDICASPHNPAEGTSFRSLGEVFSKAHNPGRKRPFDIRSVMRAVADLDHPPLERWRDMRDAETVVTWDAYLGGQPVALLGIESRPIKRVGHVPGDGPKMWTAGTFVPQSSRKMARSINAASGNRPLVILANLSGFDGSPESLRKWQLEYGAEIGRAIVNFDGPIAFTVVSRFHGGAFVVFSNRLHDDMETFALEGTFASVIGGAPAAAVVFARDLGKRITADPRVVEAEKAVRAASGPDKAAAGVDLRNARGSAHAEHLAQLATEYDEIHSIERAQRVGSVHHIIAPERLRPELIAAVERGIARTGSKS